MEWVYLALGIPVGMAVTLAIVMVMDEMEFQRRWKD